MSLLFLWVGVLPVVTGKIHRDSYKLNLSKMMKVSVNIHLRYGTNLESIPIDVTQLIANKMSLLHHKDLTDNIYFLLFESLNN